MSAKFPLNILVVDAETDSARATGRVLEQAGYGSVVAGTGANALAALRAKAIDLVLLARELPDQDGVEVCRRIKADPERADTPVVFLSARHTLSEEKVEGLQSGADGYIARPIDDRELLARVEAFARILTLTRSLRAKARELEQSNQLLRAEKAASVALRDEALAARGRAELVLESLWESEDRFRTVVESAPDAIFIETQGRFAYLNPAALRLFGADAAGDLIGRPVAEGLHPDFRMRAEALMRSFEARQQQQAAFEGVVLKRDGSPVPVEISTVAFTYEEQPGALHFARDLTERKKMEAQFLHAQRLETIGTLASGIAHDLNNILSPIMMSAALLRMRGLGEDPSPSLATIEANAGRAAEIVRRLLTFGRGVAGARVVVEPPDLVKEMVKIAQETFPRNLVIKTQLPDGLWPAMGDATQLHQVLLNLCINARDAMPDGGTLTVEAGNCRVDERLARENPGANPGPYARLVVSDTGIGIPPGDLERIFDPFFTTKEPGKGTGLGLSTVLGIVKSHGGFLQVQSQVGRGSAFAVCLPALCTEEPVLPAPVHPRPPRGRGEVILVVDDEPAICEAVGRILEKNGYRALVAADGEVAAALCLQDGQPVHLALIDLMMPQMDGYSLAVRLKKLRPEIKIAVSSGLVDALEGPKRTEWGNLGVTHFLAKPYAADKLLTMLGNILGPPGVA